MKPLFIGFFKFFLHLYSCGLCLVFTPILAIDADLIRVDFIALPFFNGISICHTINRINSIIKVSL